jgi:hypothetical protein
MCTLNRRDVLALLPASLALAGCMKETAGTETIHYGRETCAMCGMVISDAHYAAEIRGGADLALSKFDDLGCAVQWLQAVRWKEGELKEFWVMDSEDGTTWLDARAAHYVPGVITPMDYGFAALRLEKPGTVSFTTMQKAVIAMGLSSRCPPPPDGDA